MRTTANTRTANSTPSPATLPNAIDHDVACSSAASGMIATSWPSWPRMPVVCTITGARCAGNHVAMSRSTLGKTAASPAPRSMRAAIAIPTFGDSAITSWPTAIRIMPIVMIGRAP